MKKLTSVLLILALLLTLGASALAATTMYAVRNGVKVFAEKSTAATVVRTLAKGEQILVETTEGSWVGILVESGEGQSLAWIPADDLSATKPCDHVWGDWKTQKEATCTAEGQMFRTCTLCSKEETRVIDKKPHSFGDWIVRREATCSKEGERYHLCKVCGLEEIMTIEKKPHTYGNWTVLREPTCTSEGLRARWCSVCGFEHDQAIEKLPHNYGAWTVTTEATDHSAGVRTRVCADCGHTQNRSFDPEGTLRRGDKNDAVREIQELLAAQGYLKAKGVDGSFGGGTEKAITAFQQDQGLNADGVAWPETIRRLHHEFGDWECVTELSRICDGEYIRVCRECGYTERRVIPTSPSFTRGDKADAVKTVQRMLTALGYDCGKVDGSFGGKLERAWELFALEEGLTPEIDRLRPADLDALAEAWLASLPAEKRMGQGDRTTAVNLLLTVAPAESEEGLLSFDWTLSNLGREKARFVTLLLSTGGEKGDLVVVIDSARLKADGANRLSGSFTLAADWVAGAEAISFTALATEDESGALWTSNAVSLTA